MNSTPTEKQARILVVDDDMTVCALLTRLFVREGHAVVSAGTAAGALREAANGTFELVLLDIMLPDRKGTELIGPLRELDPDLAIILFTGHASLDSAMQAVREHVSAYITKPVRCEEMLAAARSALENRRLNLENRRLLKALQEELDERRRVELMLREATAEQKMILDSVPAMVWYKDTENRILRVNRAAAEAVGLAAEAIEGKSCEELFPDEAEHYYREDLTVITSGEPKLNIIERMQTASGEKRWLTTDKVPYVDEKGEIIGLVVFSADITDRVHAEQAKRTAEANYQNLIASSADAMVVVDHSGIVRFASSACADLFGRQPGELLNTTFGYPCIPGEATEIDVVRPGNEAASAEMRVTEVTWGTESCWLLSIRDTTERSRAEEALRRGAERLQVMREVDRGILAAQSLDALVQAVLQHVPRLEPCTTRACAMRFDAEEGVAHIIGVFETQPGLGPATGETMALPSPDVLDLLRQGREKLTHLCRDGENEDAFYDALARSGVRSTLSLPLLANGELLGVLTLCSDRVTDYSGRDLETARELAEVLALSIHQVDLHEQRDRHAEELEKALGEIRTMHGQLVESERFRALGNMAAGIVHEFNNSLGPIVGFSDMLLKRPAAAADEAKREKLLEIIYTAATDAAATVERLRTFYRSREHNETLEMLSVSNLVSTTVSLTKAKWKGEAEGEGRLIRVQEHLQDVPRILGSSTELRQVLANLIFNAVDAMPEGGTISVRTECIDGRVLIEVSDTGTGMSEEVRKRSLDPFFTTKHERGSGLGLAMVYGTLQRHGGTIEVESEEGKGSTFRIWLPACTEGGASPQ